MTRDELFSQMDAAGYWAKAPGVLAEEHGDSHCAISRCRQCGHLGMDFLPFYKPNDYRPYSACPACGNVEELRDGE